MKVRQSAADNAFDISNYIFMGILVLLVVLPLMNLISLAFSDGVYNHKITFLPSGVTLEAFRYVFGRGEFLRAMMNSVIITITVTVVSNILMPLAAYPLSKPDLPFRKGIMIFFVITMLFSPGIVPSYMLVKTLGLTDSILSVIVLSFLNVFNLLLYKTFFESVPEEIEEAAKIDGASSIRLFFTIVLPMSLPVLASCCFFTLVGSWNNYSGALIFIAKASNDQHPLALYIYYLLADLNDSKNQFEIINAPNIASATIVISVIPILLAYPYVIRHIKSGLSIGSVKG